MFHLTMHDALVELKQLRVNGGDALGYLQHLLFQLFSRVCSRSPASGCRFGARDGIAGEHHLHGFAHPDQPRVKMHVGHAETSGGIAHLGVFCHIHQVASSGKLAASRQAVAVHLGDDRNGEIPDAHPSFGHMPRPLAFAFGSVKGHFVADIAAAEVVSG